MQPHTLGRHVVLLTLVLAGAALAIGPHGRFNSDEGAVLITARSVAGGHGWLVSGSPADVGGSRVEFPLLSADWGTKGTASYAKHAAYPFLLAGAQRAWRGSGVIAISIAGTVLAALLAALLARRIDPRVEVGTFWLVGVASPLFVDSQLVMAHAPGAAAAIALVVAADRGRDARGARLACWLALTAAASMALLLLRTEGVFLVVGVVAGLVWTRRGEVRRPAALAVASLGGAAAALVSDRIVRRAIVGSPIGAPGAPTFSSQGYLPDRLHSMFTTLLRPGYLSTGAVAIVAMSICLVVAVAALLRRRPDRTMAMAFLGLAALAAVARAVVFPSDSVPGLLAAFPALWIGLVAGGRAIIEDDRRRFVVTAAAVSFVGVILTQYSVGGSVEWGGRYFALVLPVAAVPAAIGLRSLVHRFDTGVRPAAFVALAVIAVSLAVLGVRDQRSTQQAAATFTDAVATAGDAVRNQTGEAPVLVTTQGIVPRLAWESFPRQRWLLVDEKHPRDLVARLRRAGIREFLLVTDDARRDAPVVAGAELRSTSESEGWRLDRYLTGG